MPQFGGREHYRQQRRIDMDDPNRICGVGGRVAARVRCSRRRRRFLQGFFGDDCARWRAFGSPYRQRRPSLVDPIVAPPGYRECVTDDHLDDQAIRSRRKAVTDAEFYVDRIYFEIRDGEQLLALLLLWPRKSPILPKSA